MVLQTSCGIYNLYKPLVKLTLPIVSESNKNIPHFILRQNKPWSSNQIEKSGKLVLMTIISIINILNYLRWNQQYGHKYIDREHLNTWSRDISLLHVSIKWLLSLYFTTKYTVHPWSSMKHWWILWRWLWFSWLSRVNRSRTAECWISIQ